MARLRNLSGVLQPAVVFGLVGLLIIGLGIFCLAQLAKLNNAAADVMSQQIPTAKIIADLKYDSSAIRRLELGQLLAIHGRQQASDTLANQLLAEMEELEKRHQNLLQSAEKRNLDRQFQRAWKEYLKVRERVKKVAIDNPFQADQLAQTEGSEAFNAAVGILEEEAKAESSLALAAADRWSAIYSASRYRIAGLFVIIVAMQLIVAFAVKHGQSGPTDALLTQLQQIATKNLDIDDIEVNAHGEIGRAGSALNTLKSSFSNLIQVIADTAMRAAGASDVLLAARAQIAANSEETSAQVSLVSQAAQRVGQRLETVSSTAEQLVQTIQSIASHANEIATVAGEAVQTAEATNDMIARLANSSGEIGEVIRLITSIAEQTNLLALNATIEAARAGVAGKGFAVVANDVKELAKQVATATEDIGRKITAIQSDTQGAVDAVASITGVINQVNQISRTIAEAVEEKTATSSEMKLNVGEAAAGTVEISSSIEGVASVAERTSFRAQEAQRAAQELAEVASLLGQLTSEFKIKRRDPRLDVPLKVTLITHDAKGVAQEHFVETINISRHGALVSGFQGEIRTGQLVSLARMGKKEVFRIARVGSDQIGLSAEDPNSSIWNDVLSTIDQTSNTPTMTMATHA